MIYLNDDIAHFDFEAALPLLSEQRREQALSIRHEQGRKACAAAYLLLRKALAERFGIDDAPLFEYGAHGKPAIAGHPDIHFNMSHCREAVACAVSHRPVGIDIESIRPYKEALARYTMSDAELQQIERSERPDVAFARLWTMKEAKQKRSGEGITSRMKQVLDGTEQFETAVCLEKGYVYSVIY